MTRYSIQRKGNSTDICECSDFYARFCRLDSPNPQARLSTLVIHFQYPFCECVESFWRKIQQNSIKKGHSKAFHSSFSGECTFPVKYYIQMSIIYKQTMTLFSKLVFFIDLVVWVGIVRI